MQRNRLQFSAPSSLRACLDDPDLSVFLDREFDGTPGLIQEFPLLVGASNRARRFVIEEDGRIVTHAAWRPFCLLSGTERFSAAGIGLVTTHRERRGRGLASCVVQHCLQDAQAQGAELALLFAPQRDLYRRLGFVPAGTERMSVIENTAPGPLHGKIRVGDARDASDLLSMLSRHPLRVERSLEEFKILLAIPDVHTHVLERQGRPVAYCVEGKGRDMRGVIHEWGGAASAVGELLTAVAEGLPGPTYVLSSEAEPPPVKGRSITQALAQVRVLCPERFGSQDPVHIFGDPETPSRIPIYLWGLDSV